ncbi:MAG: bifunctional 3-deoxy-7-phosphoheptulonate synthase/chorismate mutase type II [Bacteroidales bacterium]|nr:bifunctional 3-deoxy-7-phosphoheptulonate synthase/chorismate mutase type II [Bacteroidales bacterium]
MKFDKFTFQGVNEQRPLVIAGPCSAESEEQVMETARQLSENGIKIFRAGIWKPRTRPNSFEGLGSVALPWLKMVKDELGMYTAVEVANVKHVYEALKFGVDILWIGARTTANPFAVQEIADTLKGMNIPVLIKNPVNPDVELWIGAVERLYNAGIKKLAVIHRGFASFQDSIYRNHPQWQLPIEIRRRIPDLPIITDPSHICGNRENLFQVSQKAMDLNFDGLIIESHIRPDKALSDAKQQITPDELKELLKKIVIRKPEVENGLMFTIEQLRAQIDKLDNDIMEIFEKRMKISDEIGAYKKKNNIAILQSKRWDEILSRHIANGQNKGLSEEFTKRIFYAIHQESINHQEQIMLKNE